MTNRQRVYVSAPYTSDPVGNTEVAIRAAQQLLEAGYAPLVPHLNYYWGEVVGQEVNSYQTWMELDLAWVPMADALVRLPGDSAGSDEEHALALEWGIPVYDSVEALLENPPPRPGDERFHRALRNLGLLHDRKQMDYGTDQDPLANVRASEDWGVPAWVGALIRGNDKNRRLQTYARRGSLANEGARDSFMDGAVYFILALILYDEVTHPPQATQ